MIRRPPGAGPDFSHEAAQQAKGRRLVAGVDEVGRGALAGPLCVAAAAFDPARLPDGVDDSKKLSARMRGDLFQKILDCAVATSIVFVSVEEIDRLNIRGATLTGMRRALQGLAIKPDFALIDGRDVPERLPCAAQAIIRGDGQCVSIAAASILAKVMRDGLMHQLDREAPGYGFARHVGYGVPSHLEALKRLGRSPHHRRSFRLAALGE